MASNSEAAPLLPTQKAPQQPKRQVTFNPTVSTNNTQVSSTQSRSSNNAIGLGERDAASQPMLSALNSKIRRRHSSGPPLQPLPAPPKLGAQRTTKHAQKLKLLPNPDHGEEGPDEESGRDVYSQFTRIKDPTARRDAARLGKDDRTKLPRVTAYCTGGTYKLEDLMKFLRGRGRLRGAAPKLFDECIYTPYSYATDKTSDGQLRPITNRSSSRQERRYSDSAVEVEETRLDNLIDLESQDHAPTFENRDQAGLYQNPERASSSQALVEIESTPDPRPDTLDFDTVVHVPEVFLYNYGTVVVWGMTLQEEERFLKDISKFATDKLDKDDVQVENFNFYYTREYQARIYNDFISLREKKSYMTKLAISHALSQSVKTSLYEDLVDNTIDTTKEIPAQIAMTGKVNLTRKEINMQIGELFILRINIHLQGSVLDSPELMWAEPQLDPVYQAVRSYLEMDQRVGLLTERLDVIADLLAVLKDQLTHTHGEYLEWIVIVLIGAEILVAAVNIFVDVYAGAD